MATLLGLTSRGGYRQWLYFDEATRRHQVAGFVQAYSHQGIGEVTFRTVKGAGHMVPTDRPAQAARMLEGFLDAQQHGPN